MNPSAPKALPLPNHQAAVRVTPIHRRPAGCSPQRLESSSSLQTYSILDSHPIHRRDARAPCYQIRSTLPFIENQSRLDSAKRKRHLSHQECQKLSTSDLWILCSFRRKTRAFFWEKSPIPPPGQTGINIRAAQSVLDSLEMLQDKSKGNLVDEEQAFLDKAVANIETLLVAAEKGELGNDEEE